MPLPSLRDQFGALIAASSVSCTQPELSQTNRPMVDLLAPRLGGLGFRCEVREVSPSKFNLLASYSSSSGGLVLTGHTDTMPYDEALRSSDPLRLNERDGRWYDLDSYDMKDFFLLAIKVLLPLLNQPFHQPPMILAACNEESSMAGTRAPARGGRPLDHATVIGEPTNLRPIRLRKGVMMECIEILRQSGHSSGPNLGRSALEAMHAIIGELMALRGEWQQVWNSPQFSVPQSTLNFGCIHGGDNPSHICGRCSLKFSLRPLPGMQLEQLREMIHQRLRPLAERHKVSVDYRPLLPIVPPFKQTQNSELVHVAEHLTGHHAETVAFGTEAPYFQRLGSETLVLGTGDIAYAHQPDEHLELARIEPMVGVPRRLIQHYCLMPAAS